MSKAPLDGVKILDLTRLLPGPLASMYLADLGAEVIKIEDPEIGDYARQIPPMKEKSSWNFLMMNRNKKSVTLNLKQSADKEKFLNLVKSADVVMESFRPGICAKLGIDYEVCKAINPRIVFCSLTGYGQTGPYKNKAGHDINYLGYAGILDQMGKKDSPNLINFQIADIAGGTLTSCIGILAALFRAQKNWCRRLY